MRLGEGTTGNWVTMLHNHVVKSIPAYSPTGEDVTSVDSSALDFSNWYAADRQNMCACGWVLTNHVKQKNLHSNRTSGYNSIVKQVEK